MYVSGGRGGDVYHVTNLNDDGVGSLRDAIASATGPRTVVFDVCGRIQLASTLNIDKPDITLAGQTAPGQGVCITNYGVRANAVNLILRHIRIRPGDADKGPTPGFHGDALCIERSGVIADHISASWSIDEVLSPEEGILGEGIQNVTVQYCALAEALDQTGLRNGAWDPSYNPGGPDHHGYGSLIKPERGDGVVSFHHNLLAMNNFRNPAVGTYNDPNRDPNQTMTADIRNNVLFNNNKSGYSSGTSDWVKMNYVGNYIIAGPETESYYTTVAFLSYAPNNIQIYQSGNLIDSDKDLVRDGVDTGWSMFTGTYTKASSEFPMQPVTTQAAEDAYNLVLATAGAFFWNRDSVDARVFGVNIPTMTGSVIDSQDEVGGYPVIDEIHRTAGWDTDGDGMPNAWETWYGTDPAATDNNGSRTGDGYTNLEKYLQWLIDPGTIFHAGDANGDDWADGGDLALMGGSWLMSGRTWAQCDFNGDGEVNGGDLSILGGNWMWCYAPAPAAVPEPSSGITMALAAAALILRRRGRR